MALECMWDAKRWYGGEDVTVASSWALCLCTCGCVYCLHNILDCRIARSTQGVLTRTSRWESVFAVAGASLLVPWDLNTRGAQDCVTLCVCILHCNFFPLIHLFGPYSFRILSFTSAETRRHSCTVNCHSVFTAITAFSLWILKRIERSSHSTWIFVFVESSLSSGPSANIWQIPVDFVDLFFISYSNSWLQKA